ncbi:3-oxoacyl-[acyl-carrier-protein] reductase FabG [Paramyrothecium foliicola]|nr:3-oxoacyl-[acyl-carrier-protein] reductase FabG [Paramyrothecium foliicola]
MAKTALISGGARGIGRCLVRRFCERGYRVYILDINEEELNHTVYKHLGQYAERKQLGFGLCNLRDTDDIRKQVDAAAEFLGRRIDVLVNNGAIADPHWKDGKTMADRDTLEQWKAYMDINLTAPFAVSQATLAYMGQPATGGNAGQDDSRESGPCIIHIGSFRAHHSDLNQEGYASSKAGQIGLTHSMAVSLQERGIRVNTVSPGRILVGHECKDGDDKGLTWEDQNNEGHADHHLSNRAGSPEDIANAVEFMVNSGFVTGQEIVVDGGTSKKKQ